MLTFLSLDSKQYEIYGKYLSVHFDAIVDLWNILHVMFLITVFTDVFIITVYWDIFLPV